MRERQKQQSQPDSERRAVVQVSGARNPEQIRQRYVPDAATAQFIAEASALVRAYGHAKFDPSKERGSRATI